jgi:hypothetical protein
VLELRHDLFEVSRQLAATLDDWPQHDRLRGNDACAQRDCVEVVMKMCAPPAMPGVT